MKYLISCSIKEKYNIRTLSNIIRVVKSRF